MSTFTVPKEASTRAATAYDGSLAELMVDITSGSPCPCCDTPLMQAGPALRTSEHDSSTLVCRACGMEIITCKTGSISRQAA